MEKEQKLNVRDLIYQVPDGLERIPIDEIPECVDFIKRNIYGYLNYLDRCMPCEETNKVYQQEEWKKDWLCYLFNYRRGNPEVHDLILVFGEYVASHYDELMNLPPSSTTD